MNIDGSLDEDVAMGIERRQQGDIVGIISSKVCRCVCVCVCVCVHALWLGSCDGEVIVKEKAQRSCLIARWRLTLQLPI